MERLDDIKRLRKDLNRYIMLHELESYYNAFNKHYNIHTDGDNETNSINHIINCYNNPFIEFMHKVTVMATDANDIEAINNICFDMFEKFYKVFSLKDSIENFISDKFIKGPVVFNLCHSDIGILDDIFKLCSLYEAVCNGEYVTKGKINVNKAKDEFLIHKFRHNYIETYNGQDVQIFLDVLHSYIIHDLIKINKCVLD